MLCCSSQSSIKSGKLTPSPDAPSSRSNTTKASGSSKASSFAQLLYRRRKDFSLLKLGKVVAKHQSRDVDSKEESKTQPRNTGPTIVEISGPERPTLGRAATYSEEAYRSISARHDNPAPLQKAKPQRPSAQRMRSAFELQHKRLPRQQIHDMSDASSMSQELSAPPLVRAYTSSASQERPTPPARRDKAISHILPPSSSMNVYPSFSPQHIRQSTIEEDVDLSVDAAQARQLPRLGSPYTSSSAPGQAIEPRSPAKKRSFLGRVLQRHASEGSGQIRPSTPLTEPLLSQHTPKSIVSRKSSPSSLRSYFAAVRSHSSETASPVSPMTQTASRSQHLSSHPPQAPLGLVDVKGWLDLNRGPTSSDYVASNGKRYPSVNLTAPAASSTFLPSEMKRINTPPLQPAVTVRKQRSIYRGLLAVRGWSQMQDSEDLTATPLQATRPSTSTPRRLSPPALSLSRRRSQRHSTDMYQQRVDLPASEGESEDKEDRTFSLHIPDHLPKSPLCPLHPKHAGGPKAMCPMHGRKRRDEGQDEASGRS